MEKTKNTTPTDNTAGSRKKFLLPVFIFAMLFCCLALATPSTAEAKSVKVSSTKKVTKATMKMNVGQKKKIKLKNVKSGQKIKWKSSNSKVVKIKKKKGNTVKIKAKKKGTATVTGKIGKKKVKVKVKVNNKVTEKSYTMAVKDTRWLKGPDSSDKVKWTSSNSNIVKITSTKKGKAKIKTLKEGSATVTGEYKGKIRKYKIKVLSQLDYALNYEWRTSEFKEESKQIVKEVLGDDLSQYTDAQKCYKLAMWVCDYLTYGADEYEIVNLSGEYALKNGYGGDDAYAELYYSLLREAGIKSLLVTDTYTSAFETWNLVYLDGEFYHCDIYYLDLSTDGVIYKNYDGDVDKNLETTFLCSDSIFHHDEHTDYRKIEGYGEIDTNFTLEVPECSSTKYDDKKYLVTNGIADYTSNIFTRGEV